MTYLDFPPWISYVILVAPTAAIFPFAATRLYAHLRLKKRGAKTAGTYRSSYYLNGSFSLSYSYRDHKNGLHFRTAKSDDFGLTGEKGEPLPVVFDPAFPGLSRTQAELRRLLPWSPVSTGTWAVVQAGCVVFAGARGFG
ncbi:hypothetical protein [Streptomyces sp. Wb2n-11]|uniref:hypothetical protein n=1 Tax=Streptomyces sp. Wb2n-11 TaxID=1030533 RepID=UPI000B222331|nr:hypothetical protein [Streptomyces sp. Wb2n-11]